MGRASEGMDVGRVIKMNPTKTSKGARSKESLERLCDGKPAANGKAYILEEDNE